VSVHPSVHVGTNVRATGTNASNPRAGIPTTKSNYATAVTGSALAKHPGGFVGTDIGAASTDPSDSLSQATRLAATKANNASSVFIAPEASDTRKVPIAKSSNSVSRITDPCSTNDAGTSGTANSKDSGCFACPDVGTTSTYPSQSLPLATRTKADNTSTAVCASEAGYT